MRPSNIWSCSINSKTLSMTKFIHVSWMSMTWTEKLNAGRWDWSQAKFCFEVNKFRWIVLILMHCWKFVRYTYIVAVLDKISCLIILIPDGSGQYNSAEMSFRGQCTDLAMWFWNCPFLSQSLEYVCFLGYNFKRLHLRPNEVLAISNLAKLLLPTRLCFLLYLYLPLYTKLKAWG